MKRIKKRKGTTSKQFKLDPKNKNKKCSQNAEEQESLINHIPLT